MAAANAAAHGELGRTIAIDERSEIGALARSMREMVATLHGYVAAQHDMQAARMMQAIDHVIAAEQFPGVYGEMATDINALVGSHIEVKFKLVSITMHAATCRATWTACRARRPS